MSKEEAAEVLTRYNQPDAADMSLHQAYFHPLDYGVYLASESTIYRIFKRNGQAVRRDGSREPVRRHKPTSFEATGPNQVWAYDITYVRDANHKKQFYYVFAAVDIFSRYAVHYDVFDSEYAENAVKF